MAKIPFNIKFRPQIESGEYKIETFSGYPVTIYRWDFKDKDNTPIMGSYVFEDGAEYCGGWTNEGRFEVLDVQDSFDLFIITPEHEMTEFEKAIKEMMRGYVKMPDEVIKETAAKLLELARKELKKTFVLLHKDDYQTAFDLGKAEALKDLPRWKVSNAMRSTLPIIMYGDNGMILYKDGFEISISDLEKLPKED